MTKNSSDKKRLVMIGNGMAGMKAIEEILEANPDLFEITVFGGERYPNYNRVLLSSVLAGDMGVEDIILNEEGWYEENNITLHLSTMIKEINRVKKVVISEGGLEAPYDSLIIATGSTPFMMPVPGSDMDGVVTFRDIDDCREMIKDSGSFSRAAVIGGGLLGLEAAKGLINLGMDVTVIHDQESIMNMQLDTTASGMLRAELEDQGISFKTGTLTSEIYGSGRVEGLRFSGGGSLECDLVVMAAGIRPNKMLAEGCGLLCNRGVLVNDYMQTVTDPSIFSVGECVEHRGATYGLVAPLFEQAKVLAYHIVGQGLRSYGGSVTSTKLKVSGVDVFSAGEFETDESSDVIEYMDRVGGVYKKIVLEDNSIKGAVIFGDTSDGPRFFQMMLDGTDVGSKRGTLLFGDTRLGDTGHSGHSLVSAMKDDDVVCGCNGVTKKKIVDSIKENGFTTAQEVTGCTKAGGSCGADVCPWLSRLLQASWGAALRRLRV